MVSDLTYCVVAVSGSGEPGQARQEQVPSPGVEVPRADVPWTPPRGPGPVYTHAPGLTSLQIRQEKEAELRANDAHWQRRINQLEQQHHQISELMEREYSAAVRILVYW